jgi:hypothetical protein
MARNLHVYPKAVLDGSSWTFIVKVFDQDTRANSRFEHIVAAGVTAEVPLRLLKLSFDLIVGDADADQAVDDALFLDDIRPGPQVETVWGNWQEEAEGIISGLAPGYSAADFWAEWSKQQTAAIRTDARRALVTQRGWSVPWVHQHEGDGTVTTE